MYEPPQKMAPSHATNCHCQNTGMLLYMHGHTCGYTQKTHNHRYNPTLHEGHRCWRRPLCVSVLTRTRIECRSPGQHACNPLSAALPPPLDHRCHLLPSGSLVLRYWSSAGNACKELNANIENHVCKLVTAM